MEFYKQTRRIFITYQPSPFDFVESDSTPLKATAGYPLTYYDIHQNPKQSSIKIKEVEGRKRIKKIPAGILSRFKNYGKL